MMIYKDRKIMEQSANNCEHNMTEKIIEEEEVKHEEDLQQEEVKHE